MELHLLNALDFQVAFNIYSTYLPSTSLNVELSIEQDDIRRGIIDAYFTRGSNTRGANDGRISLEELRLKVPRTATLEYIGGNKGLTRS